MTQAPNYQRAIVKQVFAGDVITVRGKPRGSPPPERQLNLSLINAPRLARRSNPNSSEGKQDQKDQPYAWESREFLRKKLVGREVSFNVDYKVPSSGREYATVFLAQENIAETLISEGLATVRKVGAKPSEEQTRLVALEEAAQAANKGLHSGEEENKHVREIHWNISNTHRFLEQNKGREFHAVIEYVRDGATVRAFLLPDFHYVTVLLSGIKCPGFKRENDGEVAEPYAEEAKFFTESRILQRDVKITLEGLSNQNFVGSVLHPNGNIAEFLLREGFGHCVEWSMAIVTSGKEKLRTAEKQAKEKRLRLWKNYKPRSSEIDEGEKQFTAKVIEIVSADTITVKLTDGKVKRITFSSLRPPRKPQKDGENASSQERKRIKPLYDIPYMFEAREFLRKKLIGNKVKVIVDYIKPASDGYPEKTCATVMNGDINVAEALVNKGFATVFRHRNDDEQRSIHYDELLSAEMRASKSGKGLHNKGEPPVHRIADISGDVSKAKQFLPFLHRAGRSLGVVEYVASGSRLRVYIPKETCLITVLLAGISCPRAKSQHSEGEPFGDSALEFTRNLCLQRDISVEIENIDRNGNFIGWVFVDNTNISVELVKLSLAKVHFSAEKSQYYGELQAEEMKAKERKIKIWEKYVEVAAENEEEVVPEVPKDTKSRKKNVVITDIVGVDRFYAQHVDSGPKLEAMTEQLRSDMKANPPISGSYKPQAQTVCAALYADHEWYRARIEKVKSATEIDVFYIDYGNRATVPATQLASLPSAFQNLPPQAHQYQLALVLLPNDEEDRIEALSQFEEIVSKNTMFIEVEYKLQNQEYVSLYTADHVNVAKELISKGYLQAANRREKRLAKLVAEYKDCENIARMDRLNIWRYGDITPDDAVEFGYNKS